MTMMHTGMFLAYLSALNSPDPSTQNGAVIMSRDGDILLAQGFNGPTLGVPYDPEMERDRRMLITEHAERAAIYAAASAGEPLEGCTMFCPWAACADCARAIVASGITRLVRHYEVMARTPERWRDSIAVADEILKAASVEVIAISDTFGVGPVRHNGQTWEP